MGDREEEIRKAAEKHAKQRGYKNFRVLSVMGRIVECRYDWIDPELHVKEFGYEATWYAVPTRTGWLFEY